MDSLTQAVLGATVQGIGMGRQQGRKALVYGALLGTLPDLDVLIRYADPVSSMTYHRGFSHSVFVLAALAAFIAWAVKKRYPDAPYSARRLFFTSAASLITHPLLDAFTVYGTQLLWPFTPTPQQWSGVFIIDPLYTVPMLLALAHAAWHGISRNAWRGLVATFLWGCAYLAFGAFGSHYHAERVRLVVDVFIVEVGQLGEGFVGLFEPVTHDVGVVVQLMHESQVFALQRAQADGGWRVHDGAVLSANGILFLARHVFGVLRFDDVIEGFLVALQGIGIAVHGHDDDSHALFWDGIDDLFDAHRWFAHDFNIHHDFRPFVFFLDFAAFDDFQIAFCGHTFDDIFQQLRRGFAFIGQWQADGYGYFTPCGVLGAVSDAGFVFFRFPAFGCFYRQGVLCQ